MKLLLDAHAVIWAVDEPSRLGTRAMTAMQDPANELMFSSGSVWELAIKLSLGKLKLSVPFRQWIETAVADLGLTMLPIGLEHAEMQTRLSFHHRDPFDRLLVAQASVEGIDLISADAVFDQYGIRRVW